MWNLFKFLKHDELHISKRQLVSIRLEAIGGQGANSAGKILAETAVIGEGFTGNHFSSFGSEKRGTPVRSFVRFALNRNPIRSATSIKKPDLLVIFHESLIHTHQEILEGCDENTDVIVNTVEKTDRLRFPEGFKCRYLVTLKATEMALKNKCGLNAVMLGAVSTMLPELDQQKLLNYFSKFFSKLSESDKNHNISGYRAGAEKNNLSLYRQQQSTEQKQKAILPELGWANAPLGGVITNPGNSILKDHSASRKGLVPKLHTEICFNCGYCDMVCPDFCFVWQKPENYAEKKYEQLAQADESQKPHLLGIDYQYCKGCQKCIQVCPIQALELVEEESLTAEDIKYHLFKK